MTNFTRIVDFGNIADFGMWYNNRAADSSLSFGVARYYSDGQFFNMSFIRGGTKD